MMKYFLVLFLSFFMSNISFSQNDINDINDGNCLTIILPRQSINDSLKAPVFLKGYDNLIQKVKHYIFYTNSLIINENEFKFCDFWIILNREGKIVNSKILSAYYLPDQFINDFPNLLEEINYWSPSYQKLNNRTAEKYLIFFRIEIYRKEIKIRLLTSDMEVLYEQTLKRPLKE